MPAWIGVGTPQSRGVQKERCSLWRLGRSSRCPAGHKIHNLVIDEHEGFSVDDQRCIARRVFKADARGATVKLVMPIKVINPGVSLRTVDVKRATVRAIVKRWPVRFGDA